MPRRDYRHAQKGQVYCVEWPEWHVECAADGCGQRVMVAGVLESVMTVGDADKRMRAGGDEIGADAWKRVNGLWYCPEHSEEK